jgi:hypothetical protein
MSLWHCNRGNKKANYLVTSARLLLSFIASTDVAKIPAAFWFPPPGFVSGLSFGS